MTPRFMHTLTSIYMPGLEKWQKYGRILWAKQLPTQEQFDSSKMGMYMFGGILKKNGIVES